MGIEVTTRPAESRAPAASGPGAQGGEAAAGFGALLGSMDLPADDASGGDASTAALPPQNPRPDARQPARADKTDKADRADKGRRAGATDDTADAAPGDDAPVDAAADGDATDATASAPTPASAPWLAHVLATQQPTGGAQAMAALLAGSRAAGDAADGADPAAAEISALESGGRGDAAEAGIAPGTSTPALPGAARGARAEGDAAVTTTAERGRPARARVPGAPGQASGADAGSAATRTAPSATSALQALQHNAAQAQGAGREAAQPLSAQLAQAEELDPSLNAALQALTGEGGVSRRLARAIEGRGEEARTPGGGWQPEGVGSRHTLSADAPLPVAAGTGTTASGMDDRMDAQMNYWLSQKTHNAELTLDTQDGRSVEVSIALNGREAQVAFRAEQAGTRELLGSALPQLREALDGQGLVLAGVTVDSFGARGQGEGAQGEAGRQGRGAAGARAVSMEGVAGSAAPAGAVRPGASSRGLDLYV